MEKNAQNTKYRCNPAQFCKTSLCCKSKGSSPIVTPGDFIRISKFTGMSAQEVWEKYGSVDVYHYDKLPGFTYQVSLSLLHNPCPYLNNENFGCDIYSARPIMCEVSPYNLFLQGDTKDHLDVFSCLKNTAASAKNMGRASELMEIVKKECLFAKNLMPLGYFAKSFDPINDFPELAVLANRIMLKRDPESRTALSKAVSESISQMMEIRKKASHTKSMDLGINFFGELLAPLLHAIALDNVSSFFGNLNNETLSFYSETTKERESFTI